MVKLSGKVTNGGGVEPTEEVEVEVDEISEQVHPDILQGINPTSLDYFLREIHGTTSVGDENGLPSVEWIRRHFKTKSAAIRYLHHKGHKVRDISKHLGLRYQHVRNVLTQELKRGPNENWTLAEDEEARVSPGLTKI